jgi:hypothetical protein
VTSPRVVVATGKHRPHEVAFFAWSVYTGVPYLLGIVLPNSTQAITRLSLTLLSTALVVAGVAGLVGCFWRGDVRTGLEIERGALTMRGGFAALFAALIFVAAGGRGWSAGGFLLFLTAADLWRGWIITRDLRQIKKQVERHRRHGQ